MKMSEVRIIARSQGIVPGRNSRTELIRKIQEREGNEVCFGGREECGRSECKWRSMCLWNSSDS